MMALLRNLSFGDPTAKKMVCDSSKVVMLGGGPDPIALTFQTHALYFNVMLAQEKTLHNFIIVNKSACVNRGKCEKVIINQNNKNKY